VRPVRDQRELHIPGRVPSALSAQPPPRRGLGRRELYLLVS
jgi:hypothetical protein